MSAAGRILEGQVALVTGASSGLGRRFAQLLASQGAVVGAAARRIDRLADLSAEASEAGDSIIPITMDVADPESIEAGIESLTATAGLPTILINNAGIPDARRAHRMPLELTDAVLDTNLRGPFLLSTSIAGRLIEAGRPGRIINISSMGAFSYTGNGAALYSITKAAVNRMTEVLAVEWATHSINVNAIAPGAFYTEMMAGMIKRVGDPSASFPRGRMGSPEMLDSSILYLLSEESTFVTGTVLKVDDVQGGR